MRNATFIALALIGWMPLTASAADITIEIRGNGTTAQYIQVPPASGNPADRQLNVVVAVGDKVIWTNRGDAQHTAHSDLRVPNGAGGFRHIFEERIDAGASQDYTFTAADYTDARTALGVPDGQAVHLGYYCSNHPSTMGGKIVLTRSAVDRDRFLREQAGHGEKRKSE